MRIGGGLGYKTPSLFTDEAESLQYQNVAPLTPKLLDAERSTGYNIDLNRSFELSHDISLDLNLLLFYTQVEDPLRLIAQDDGTSVFSQPYEQLDTRGTEINAVWRWQDFKLFLGYTLADVHEHQANGIVDYPLMPDERVNTVLVYELEDDLRVGLEAYYYSSQKLNDGSRSKDYWIFGLMMEKKVQDRFSVFLNFENFTDTRQSRFEPIYTGSVHNPVFRDIYAPLDGFVVNGGIKINL